VGEREGRWFVQPVLVERDEEGGDAVWRFTKHIFVGSAGDGGLAPLLKRLGEWTLPTWKERASDDPDLAETGDWQLEETDEVGDAEEEVDVRAACQCGAIDFRILRGDGGREKWKGKHCACTSCVRATSTPVSSWFRVPESSITPTFSTLSSTTYKPSAGVTRSFCGTCGASVSYTNVKEPGVVCVAAGLVRERNVRLERLVEWDRSEGGLEDMKALGMGMEKVGEALQKSLEEKKRI
jgi:hypothetical protein